MLFRNPKLNSVAADRYTKNLHEQDVERSTGHYIHAGLAGAALGLALRKPGMTRKAAALRGVGGGVGTQAVVRAATGTTIDRFNDRSAGAKQVDKLPTAALLAGAVVAGHRRVKAKFGNAANAVKGAVKGAVKKVMLGAKPNRVVRFGVVQWVKANRTPLAHGGALAGGIAAADAITSGLLPEEGQTRGDAASHGLAKGAVYGTALAAAEPQIYKLLKKGRRVVVTALSSLRRGEIRFAEEDGKKRRIAGVTAAAVGALALPAAIPILRIPIRGKLAALGMKSARHNIAGKNVHDYILASQRALNQGLHGKVAGGLINSAKRNAKGTHIPTPGKPGTMAEHLGGFRSSPAGALDHWSWEASESMRMKGKHEAAARMDARHAAAKASVASHVAAGKSEMDAVRAVTEMPEHANHMNTLNAHMGLPRTPYSKLGAIAPAALAGGAGLYASGHSAKNRKPDRSRKGFNAMSARSTAIHFGPIPALRLGDAAASTKRLWLRKARKSSIEGLRKVADVPVRSVVPSAFSSLRKPILFGGNDQLKDSRGRMADPLKVASGEISGGFYRSGASGKPVFHAGDREGNAVGVMHGQVVRAAYNKGAVIHKYGGRAKGLLSDTVSAARGEKQEAGKKREWQKAWFKRAAGAALVGAALLGHTALMRRNAGYRAKVVGATTAVKKKVNKFMPDTFADTNLSARIAPAGSARFRRTIHFDMTAPEWDVRDGRGRSARVFAPGARARTRREKKTHETVGFLRKAAVIGSVAALAAGAGLGYKLRGKGWRRIPAAAPAEVGGANIIQFPARA